MKYLLAIALFVAFCTTLGQHSYNSNELHTHEHSHFQTAQHVHEHSHGETSLTLFCCLEKIKEEADFKMDTFFVLNQHIPESIKNTIFRPPIS